MSYATGALPNSEAPLADMFALVDTTLKAGGFTVIGDYPGPGAGQEIRAYRSPSALYDLAVRKRINGTTLTLQFTIGEQWTGTEMVAPMRLVPPGSTSIAYGATGKFANFSLADLNGTWFTFATQGLTALSTYLFATDGDGLLLWVDNICFALDEYASFSALGETDKNLSGFYSSGGASGTVYQMAASQIPNTAAAGTLPTNPTGTPSTAEYAIFGSAAADPFSQRNMAHPFPKFPPTSVNVPAGVANRPMGVHVRILAYQFPTVPAHGDTVTFPDGEYFAIRQPHSASGGPLWVGLFKKVV